MKIKRFTISDRFSIIISLSIFISVLFTSIYNLYASYSVINFYQMTKELNYKSISNAFFESVKSEINKNDFSGFESISKNMVKNNVLLYVGVIDKSSKKYLWSSVEELKNTTTDSIY